VIGVELAVAGALHWQMRFFESRNEEAESPSPHPRIRLLLAVVLGGTLFASRAPAAGEGRGLAQA